MLSFQERYFLKKKTKKNNAWNIIHVLSAFKKFNEVHVDQTVKKYLYLFSFPSAANH